MASIKTGSQQAIKIFINNVWPQASVRCISSTFKFSDLEVQTCSPNEKKTKPHPSKLAFGKNFTDHMFEVEWTQDSGWGKPRISPLHNLTLHPAAKVLHYATEVFEGMKAFRCVDGKVRLFRPDMNVKRLLATSERASLPTFDKEELLACLKKLVSIEKDWVPNPETNASMYLRPTFIGTDPTLGVNSSSSALLYVIVGPAGPYFATGIKPVSLMADPKYVRAWPGGCGDKKMGSNYGPTIAIQKKAEANKHQQVLWLYGEDHQLTEVGTMNIFVHLVNEQGERELVTPPLNGLILPGITRISLLELAKEWNDFKVTERTISMAEVTKALNDGRLLEIFGAGTACVVCPVGVINFKGTDIKIPSVDDQSNPLSMRFHKALTDIQYGRVKHSWAVDVD